MSELILRASTGFSVLVAGVTRRLREERGQTSSEYLLIAGMAVVIIIAILGVFSDELQDAADSIMSNITGEVQ